RWVLKHLDEIEERNRYVRPPQWISGESIRYLGRRYVLKVIEAPEQRKTNCKLIRGQLRVQGRNLNPARTQKAVGQWYRERALVDIDWRLWWIVATQRRPNWLLASRMQVVRLESGSCCPVASVLLFPSLRKTAGCAIHYVSFHKVCPLVEYNNS